MPIYILKHSKAKDFLKRKRRRGWLGRPVIWLLGRRKQKEFKVIFGKVWGQPGLHEILLICNKQQQKWLFLRAEANSHSFLNSQFLYYARYLGRLPALRGTKVVSLTTAFADRESPLGWATPQSLQVLLLNRHWVVTVFSFWAPPPLLFVFGNLCTVAFSSKQMHTLRTGLQRIPDLDNK